MSYPHFRSDWELRLGVTLWQVVSPILLVFGTIGNCLSIIILSKKRFRNWSATHYLIALAGADIAFHYIGLLRQWVKYTWDEDIRFVSNAACKIHWWLMYSSADMPVWILVTITIERLISTIVPHKSKRICTAKVARIVLIILPTMILLINCHLLYGFGRLEVDMDNGTKIIPCAPLTAEYETFFTDIWTWIDLCKFSLVPFAVLSVGNFCIIWSLFISGRRSKTQIAPTQASSAPKGNNKTSTMSVLLVCLNVVFIICTAPVCVYFIGEPYWIPKDVPRSVQLQDPWWAFVNILMYTNSTINFILYCLSGSKFRGELKKMFLRRKTENISRASAIHDVSAPPTSRTM